MYGLRGLMVAIFTDATRWCVTAAVCHSKWGTLAEGGWALSQEIQNVTKVVVYLVGWRAI